jgi:hypothetical protein
LPRRHARPDFALEEPENPPGTGTVCDAQAQPRSPLDQRLPHGFRLGLTRQRRDFLDQAFDFGILDVECHGSLPSQEIQ